jgi:hypothetical protein
VQSAADGTEADGWRLTAELGRIVFGSGDAIEGSTAFVEKRAPNWNPPAL